MIEIAFITLVLLFIIELKYKPRFDWTSESALLLWYNNKLGNSLNKRKYFVIFKSIGNE